MPNRAVHPRARSIFKARTKKPNFVLSVAATTIRLSFIIALCVGLALLGAVIGIAKAFVDTAPTLDLAALDAQDKTSFIYDSQGNLITDYKGTEDRIMVSIDEIPEMLQNAFIAVEDARFYEHNGVDVKRIVGALVANFTSGSTQGGSTITQQLIKQTVLSSEQSYKRKLQEAYLAMELETRYTKKQILESYLNTIFLGGSYYGVRVAAYGYFGKSLDQLTLRECAMLAGLTRSPNYYNPRSNFYTRNTEGSSTPDIITNSGTQARTKLPANAPCRKVARSLSNTATKASQLWEKTTRKQAITRRRSTQPMRSRAGTFRSGSRFFIVAEMDFRRRYEKNPGPPCVFAAASRIFGCPHSLRRTSPSGQLTTTVGKYSRSRAAARSSCSGVFSRTSRSLYSSPIASYLCTPRVW